MPIQMLQVEPERERERDEEKVERRGRVRERYRERGGGVKKIYGSHIRYKKTPHIESEILSKYWLH